MKKTNSLNSDSPSKQDLGFALGKENYILLAIGFVIIIIGYLLMIGGGSEDPYGFSEEIFSFQRITLSPLVILFGFAFEVWAIMKKPNNNNTI